MAVAVLAAWAAREEASKSASANPMKVHGGRVIRVPQLRKARKARPAPGADEYDDGLPQILCVSESHVAVDHLLAGLVAARARRPRRNTVPGPSSRRVEAARSWVAAARRVDTAA